MRQLAAGLVALGLAVLVGRADDTPAPKSSPANHDLPAPKSSPAYDALKKEFTAAQTKHAKVLQEAKKAVGEATTDAAKREAQKKLGNVTKNPPGPKYAALFLEFAEKHPKDPMAFAAAMTAFNFSPKPATRNNTHGQAIAYLQHNYAAKPQIKQLVRILEAAKAPAGQALLREVLAKNPDRRIQGHACKALVAVSTRAGEKKNLNKRLKEEYADLFPDLSVGKHAPEIVTKNIHGKTVKLSDLKGKVVVLDFWATWCPYCRAMIPDERAMVARLKGKPFVLVSISIDEKMATLPQFLAKEKMPWTHWWVGPSSNLAEDWDVEYYPTIYVVDARGVIRYINLKGEKLEEAVTALLREMNKKKK
jgi:thiol-disulfide isomerase/thioredoxin